MLRVRGAVNVYSLVTNCYTISTENRISVLSRRYLWTSTKTACSSDLTSMGKLDWYPITSLVRRPIYCNGLNTSTWRGPQAIVSDISETDTIIILNGEQNQSPSILQNIWKTACLKVAVDGGANFVYDMLGAQRELWPDFITGDFDSIRKDVLKYYKEQGIPAHYTPDQNETDFLKCLRIVVAEIQSRCVNTDRILVFGAYGGRLDHMFANVNTLTIASQWTDVPIYLLDDHQQAFLLSPGNHVIHIEEPHIVSWCGLVPVSQPVIATTSGLKWNLEKEVMRYGAVISTSNKVVDNTVSIQCDGALLWMMGFSAHLGLA